MLERERHNLILKLVDERSIVSIAQIVELLSASEATIRRDISALAEQALVRRIRGGAEAIRPRHEARLVGMPFALSQGFQVPQKRAIARAASKLIESGDSIIIGGGSTTYALVEFLPNADLDVLTNSFPIAARLMETSRNRITLPGGTYYREQQIILSPFEKDSSENFSASKFFTGCFGINRLGVMETDPLIARAQTRLLKRADKVIVMADSSKLRKRSSMVVYGLERISILITDEGAAHADLEFLRAAGTEVIVAPVLEEDGVTKSA
jgi:DeoR family ulaG and ulaABCDEF operon transcriptional repressor